MAVTAAEALAERWAAVAHPAAVVASRGAGMVEAATAEPQVVGVATKAQAARREVRVDVRVEKSAGLAVDRAAERMGVVQRAERAAAALRAVALRAMESAAAADTQGKAAAWEQVVVVM